MRLPPWKKVGEYLAGASVLIAGYKLVTALGGYLKSRRQSAPPAPGGK